MKDVKILITIWCILALASIANSFIFPMALFVKIVSWIFGTLNIFAMIGFLIISKQDKNILNYDEEIKPKE